MKDRILHIAVGLMLLVTTTGCPGMIGESMENDPIDIYFINESFDELYVWMPEKGSDKIDMLRVKPFRNMKIFHTDLLFYTELGIETPIYVFTEMINSTTDQEEIKQYADTVINISYATLMDSHGVYRITESDVAQWNERRNQK